MIDTAQTEKIKEFVQQRVEQIYYIKPDNQSLINQIVRLITVSEFGGIIGEYGTGKRQIVDEIISPGFKKFYGLSSITKYNISINNPRIDEIISGKSEKLLIVSDIDPLSIIDDHLSPTLRLVQERLTNYDILQLPSLQQRYLDYPEIIANIVKQEYGIPNDRVKIGICGYIESMISKMPGNYLALQKLILTEFLNHEDFYKNAKSPVVRIGFYLRFNTYFDTLIERRKLWRSFWDSSNSFPLKKIQEFNKQYIKNGHDVVELVSSGPWRKHPQELILKKLKKYCRALIANFNEGSIEDAVTRPIDEKIIQLSNLTNEKSKLNGWLYYFSAEEQSSKVLTSNIIKEDDSSDSILNYDTIEIRVPGKDSSGAKCDFRLIGKHGSTKPIKMIPSHATFLLYLAKERKAGGKNWLIEPEEHLKIIQNICNRFYLDNIYIEECQEDEVPDNPKTWIRDHYQSKRRFIVAPLNTKLREKADFKDTDYLIVNQEGTLTRKGNYSLAKHITIVRIIKM
ncbi:hypothetical protein HQ585_08225 [candidate division KSB1 bacterium]|nr:hypothetical protein [candidate division KSB1 bacterium]